MRRFLTHLLLWSGWLVLGGCVDRYTPDVPAAAQTSLVVDGFINPQGSTVITLARTFSVNTKSTAPAETRAQVAIQDDAGRRYGLTESAGGIYTSAAQVLDPSRQYQLRITTASGREYASELVPVKTTPPIDQLTWKTENGGVRIYVSTHDATAASRYYRWDYDETWQFTSAYESSVKYVPRPSPKADTVIQRLRSELIFTCWRTESSTNITQSNSTLLSQDIIADYPLLFVPPSPKIRLGYSVLVHQVAQTPAEYTYWDTLRKNTENLGTVNDPLPARVTGNMHCLSDASEAVLGYVGAHSVTEKRLFIAASVLPIPQPNAVFFDPSYTYCQSSYAQYAQLLVQCKASLVVPIQPSFDTSGHIISCTTSSAACVDCTLRGTNVKPSYWP